jgi:hypothetical protein
MINEMSFYIVCFAKSLSRCRRLLICLWSVKVVVEYGSISQPLRIISVTERTIMGTDNLEVISNSCYRM